MSALDIAAELFATSRAVRTVNVPSLVTGSCTFVLDRLPAERALVRIVGRETRHSYGDVERIVVTFEGLKVGQVLQELVQTIRCVALFLYPQGTLQAYSDEQLEVVCKASDKGQELLRDAKLLVGRVLGLGQQREEGNNLLAQKLGLAAI